MSKLGWAVLATLGAWASLTIVRRIAERRDSERSPDAEAENGSPKTSLKDDIDWQELEKAEDEVRNLDPEARPEEGFEGDDWGPGSVRPPRPPVA